MVKLDDNLRPGDRRTIERTEAWFAALESVREINIRIRNVPATHGGNAIPAALRTSIGELMFSNWRSDVAKLIRTKGHLGVWLKIFADFDHPLGVGQSRAPVAANPVGDPHNQPQHMTLMQDVATELREKGYFPGTNWEAIRA